MLLLTKKCGHKKCKQINPQTLDCFYKNKLNKDGLQHRCKSCYNEDKKKDSYKAYQKEYNKKKYIEQKNDPLYTERIKKYKGTPEQKLSSKKTHLKTMYNISLDDYNALLKKQSNVCAICLGSSTVIDKRTNKPRSLSVDHCHKTGKVRGLLCSHCNFAIGSLKDNTNIIYSAYNYLKILCVNDKETIVAFDVDMTLVIPDNKFGEISITNPYSGTTANYRPHKAHIELLKQYKGRGNFVRVWSNGGVKWAVAVVKALGLEEYVNSVETKPFKLVDDLPADKIFKNVIYLNENGEENK